MKQQLLEKENEELKHSLSRFVTKDSGKRSEYTSGMVRDSNEEKARFDLCIPEGIPYDDQMLTRFAKLMQRGALKYTSRNWEKADGEEELLRFKESALRHMMQWFCGEVDEDHAAAVWFNIMAYETTQSKIKHQNNHYSLTKDECEPLLAGE